MATSPVDNRKQRKRNIVFAAIVVLLVLLAVGFLWIDPYLNAASILLRVSDPTARGFLARHDENAVAISPTVIPTPAGPVRGNLYVPIGVKDPPAMLVLHGVHHLGIQEPRLVNFSKALSTHGVLVMTPEMADLADYHVEPTAIDVIGASAHDLKIRTGADSVSVLGLSFAGGLALVAASDPKYANDIGVVASIGGYANLARVLRFYATNEVETVNGTMLHMKAHEYGILVVAYAHPEEFFPKSDVELARDAIRLQLWEKVNEARKVAARLSPAGRATMEALLDNKTQVLSADLLRALAQHEAETSFVSPEGKLGSIKADVFLAHGAGDNVIPPTEAEWLVREVPPARLRMVLISPVISHVELGGKPTWMDRWRLVDFMEEFLRDSRQRAGTRHPITAIQQQQFAVPQTPGTQPWSR